MKMEQVQGLSSEGEENIYIWQLYVCVIILLYKPDFLRFNFLRRTSDIIHIHV